MSTPRRLVLLLPLLVLALVVGACSGGDGEADGSTSGDAAAQRCPDGTTASDGLCVAGGDDAGEMAAAVRRTFTDAHLGAIVVGVWRDGEPLVVGALGESIPGSPATTEMHLPVGNLSASYLTTVFLQLVDEDVLSLDATLATWFPDLPAAGDITLDQLAHSTTGYVHHPPTDEFVDDFTTDPFRNFTPEELVAYAVPHGTPFAPGSGWQFSDTNLVLLGLVIEAETGQRVDDLIKERILDSKGLDNTVSRRSGEVAAPVLHGFTDERGVWEEATHWTPTWVPWAGDMASNLDDARRWIEIVGRGELLSGEMHEQQLAPTTVGLGPNTEQRYYAMGMGVTSGWIFTNPGLQGYRATVGYDAEEDVTIVIFTTFSREADTEDSADTGLFQELGSILVPERGPMAAR